MKKRLILLALAAVLLCGCGPVAYDGPTETKSVLVEYVTVHSPWADHDPWVWRTLMAYDTWGNQVERRDYRDDELDSVEKQTFDENGNRLSYEAWDHSGWLPKLDYRMQFTYDDQGRVLTEVSTDFWGKETDRRDYTYDDEARTTTVVYSMGVTIVRYYDENGLLLLECQTDDSGDYQMAETVYAYDENGNEISWHHYVDGVLDMYVLSEYSDRGRKTYSARYDANGQKLHDWTYTYNEKTNSETLRYYDGDYRVTYYDDDGFPLRIEDYNTEGRVTMTQTYIRREIQVPATGEE